MKWCLSLYALLLAVFGAASDRLGVWWEYDAYPRTAAAMLAGHLPSDPYHPYGYPLLIAPVAALLGDPLAAGRLVSALGAALLAGGTFELARLWDDRRRGWAALSLAMANGCLFGLGLVAAADATGAALVALSLVAVARHASAPRTSTAAWAGVWAGAALAVRYPAMVLAPLVLLTVVSQSPRGSGRPRALAAAAGGMLLGYAPHGVLSVVSHGALLWHAGWQNMVLKCAYGWDVDAFGAGGREQLLPFLLEHWQAVGRGALQDLAQVAQGTMASLLLGAALPAAAALAVFALTGAACASAARRRPGARCAVAFALLHTLQVCTAFHADERALLPVLPVALTSLCCLPWLRLGRAGAPIVAAMALAMAAAGWSRQLAALSAQEPRAEVALARELPALLGHSPVLATTYLLMEDRVPYLTRHLPTPGPRSQLTPAAAWARVAASARRQGCDSVLVGARSGPDLFARLQRAPPPAELTPLRMDKELMLLQLRPTTSAWFADVTVVPAVVTGGELRLEVQLAAAADPARVRGVGFLVDGADGGQQVVDLERLAARRWGRRLRPLLAKARYRLLPVLLLEDGTVERGPATSLEVR